MCSSEFGSRDGRDKFQVWSLFDREMKFCKDAGIVNGQHTMGCVVADFPIVFF